MISGFLGPVGTLICGFEYTEFLSKAKKHKQIFRIYYWCQALLLELKQFQNVGKGGCRKILTVNVEDFGCQNWKLLFDKWWGFKEFKVFENGNGYHHLGISINL